MDAISRRYGRQYGLVRQEQVENLNVLVVGYSPVMIHLTLNLAFAGCGVLQGGVYLHACPDEVSADHIKGQFLLRTEDEGKPFLEALANRVQALVPTFDLQEWPLDGRRNIIPDATVILEALPEDVLEVVPRQGVHLHASISAASVLVDLERRFLPQNPFSVLTPALASLAGALAAQEVLRVTNSLRAFGVVEQALRAHLRIKAIDLPRPALAALRGGGDIGVESRLKLGGEPLQIVSHQLSEDGADALLEFELPKESLLTRLILDSIDVVEEPLVKLAGEGSPIFYSVLDISGPELVTEGESREQWPERLEELTAVVLGVGGLGTWASALLACTPSDRCRISVVDSDDRIEEHNLNRQILYAAPDVGSAKVHAAARVLQEINEALEVHTYQMMLVEDFLLYLDQQMFEEYDADAVQQASISDEEGATSASSLMMTMLAKDLAESQVCLSCLDNMHARWVLNGAACIAGKLFVNGGVDGLTGAADYIEANCNDASLMTRYGKDIRGRLERHSCTGTIPVPSIVTLNAVIASIEALHAVLAALGRRPATNYLFYHGAHAKISKANIVERGEPDPLSLDTVLAELRTEYGLEA